MTASATQAAPAAPTRQALPPVVVTRLVGGLGNQLFQYAAGRRLALRLGVPLKLDVSAFARYPRRSYRLSLFNIEEAFATEEELESLRAGAWGQLLQRLRPLARRTHVRERHFHFDPEVLGLRAPVYLAGYWQSERYFADVADTIRADFTPRDPPQGANREALARIQGCESVSVHVRRGDYVSNPRARRVHGACPVEYYQRAFAAIAERAVQPHYFVFSDDAAWVRAHLRFDAPVTYVDHNGPDGDVEDLRLMSACRHHVIANSTFSWWAAWLGRHEGGMVLAPDRWFATRRLDPRDLYLASWRRL